MTYSHSISFIFLKNIRQLWKNNKVALSFKSEKRERTWRYLHRSASNHGDTVNQLKQMFPEAHTAVMTSVFKMLPVTFLHFIEVFIFQCCSSLRCLSGWRSFCDTVNMSRCVSQIIDAGWDGSVTFYLTGTEAYWIYCKLERVRITVDVRDDLTESRSVFTVCCWVQHTAFTFRSSN